MNELVLKLLIQMPSVIECDTILVEKAKLLANGLRIPEGEAESADEIRTQLIISNSTSFWAQKDVVYEIPANDQVIEKLIKTFKLVDLACDDSEDDNSIEIPLINIDTVITSLETVSMFLLQQDEAN
ncbi:17192_t:CDS:2, partial [Dentiscutata heterogama]